MKLDIPVKQKHSIREKIDGLEGSKTAELAFFEEDDEGTVINKLIACAGVDEIEEGTEALSLEDRKV